MDMLMQSKILVIAILVSFLSDIEAMRVRGQDHRASDSRHESIHRRRITRKHAQVQPRNIQLARQLSPQRTFTRMGHFGQFRTPQRLRAQRHYLHRVFRGHNWYWWWRHRPHIFYTYFPFFFYNTYGYYPPIYYDYFDAYGTYPIAYSYIASV